MKALFCKKNGSNGESNNDINRTSQHGETNDNVKAVDTVLHNHKAMFTTKKVIWIILNLVN